MSLSISLLFYSDDSKRKKDKDKDKDDKSKNKCIKKFEKKCFDGQSVDYTNFFSPEDVNNFCEANATGCSLQECKERMYVLLGYAPPGKYTCTL